MNAVNRVNSSEANILKAMNNIKRDLSNNLIRSKAKVTKIAVGKVREEVIRSLPNQVEILQKKMEMKNLYYSQLVTTHLAPL